MTQDSSRKSFLGRVLGLATVGALASRSLARGMLADPGAAKPVKKAAFRLRPQERAVARREGAA